MYGLFLILLFYLLGCLVSALLDNFIPGSVIGMILLFGALSLKWVRPGHVKKVSTFLIDHMMLFFIPVGVGLITSYTLLSRYHRRLARQHGARDRGGRPRRTETRVQTQTGGEAMNEIIYSQIFLLTLTVGVYLGAVQLRRRVNCALLHPILVSVAALIAFVKLTGMPYEHYMRQTQIIDFLLGLSVVALGYVLHDQIYNIRGNVISIVIAIVTGSAVGILSVALIARWMGAEPAVVASLEPKSVTTAIALSLSANSGGIPALTSVVVIVVGVFGGIVGPWVLRKVGVESRIAKGLAMGAAAHAMGTARAMELGAVEGAISGLAIGLMGVATAVLVPILEKII